MMKAQHSIAAFVISMGLIAVPACAGQRVYSVARDDRNVERRAYDEGYRRGLDHGQRDARERRDFKVDRDRDYRNVNDRDRFSGFFKDGYREGYREGYQRVAQFERGRPGPRGPIVDGPRNGSPYASRAASIGYRDGVEAGRDDASHGEKFDPRRVKRYREGDRDYNDREGSRDQYKQQYRAAFLQGYEQGFRSYRR